MELVIVEKGKTKEKDFGGEKVLATPFVTLRTRKDRSWESALSIGMGIHIPDSEGRMLYTDVPVPRLLVTAHRAMKILEAVESYDIDSYLASWEMAKGGFLEGTGYSMRPAYQKLMEQIPEPRFRDIMQAVPPRFDSIIRKMNKKSFNFNVDEIEQELKLERVKETELIRGVLREYRETKEFLRSAAFGLPSEIWEVRHVIENDRTGVYLLNGFEASVDAKSMKVVFYSGDHISGYFATARAREEPEVELVFMDYLRDNNISMKRIIGIGIGNVNGSMVFKPGMKLEFGAGMAYGDDGLLRVEVGNERLATLTSDVKTLVNYSHVTNEIASDRILPEGQPIYQRATDTT